MKTPVLLSISLAIGACARHEIAEDQGAKENLAQGAEEHAKAAARHGNDGTE